MTSDQQQEDETFLSSITKIQIRNYRVFRDFEVNLDPGLNIVVGDNDSGKSTLLEAARLALSGKIGRNRLIYELSPHLFNKEVVQEYVAAIHAGEAATPPEIVIDIHLVETPDTVDFIGANNLKKEPAPGLSIHVLFDNTFQAEYDAHIAGKNITMVPAEYYKVEWRSFQGDAVTARSVKIATSTIDATTIRLQSGVDFYLQKIIQDRLTTNERAELTRAYRSICEEFSDNPSVAEINKKMNEANSSLSKKELSLGIDVTQAAAWERILTPHLDAIPFHLIGHGDQNAIKILLALERERDKADIVLVEEPENHMSPASLTELLSRIAKHSDGKQMLISTHSSYVLNKLGLEHLLLIHKQAATRLTELDESTWNFFMKLPGYDTLRLVLARKAILVEGPSDELIVQRAYMDEHNGRLPMDDQIDVVSVGGRTCKRFLKIAKPLGKDVVAVIDNDGRSLSDIGEEFKEFTTDTSISVHAGDPASGRSLEPQLVHANELATLNEVLEKNFATTGELEAFMSQSKNKTECALKIFEAEKSIVMPAYVKKAVGGGD